MYCSPIKNFYLVVSDSSTVRKAVPNDPVPYKKRFGGSNRVRATSESNASLRKLQREVLELQKSNLIKQEKNLDKQSILLDLQINMIKSQQSVFVNKENELSCTHEPGTFSYLQHLNS